MYRYIIGNTPIPTWLHKHLYQYRRMDGSTGFELWYTADGEQRQAELNVGDVVIWRNGLIHFRRRAVRE